MPMSHGVIKKSPQSPQIDHPFFFANLPLKYANCQSPLPIFLGNSPPRL